MPPRSSFCNRLGLSRLFRFGIWQLPAILWTLIGLILSFAGSLDCHYFIISARLQVFNEEGELLSDGRTLGGGIWTVQDGKSCIEWPEDVNFDAWIYVGKTMSALSCILAGFVTLLMLRSLVSDQPRTRYMKAVACAMMILTNIESSTMFVMLTKMCKDPYTCRVGRSGFISIAASGVWFFTALLTSTLKFQADTLSKATEVQDTCKNNRRGSFRSTVSHLPIHEDEDGCSGDLKVFQDEQSERSCRSRDVEMPLHKPLKLPDKQRPALDRATSARSTESTIMTGDGSMSLASAHMARSRAASVDLSVASAHTTEGRASSLLRTFSNTSTDSGRKAIIRDHSMNSEESTPSSSLSNARMPQRYVDRVQSMNSTDGSVASIRPGHSLAPTQQHDRPSSVSRTHQPRNIPRSKSINQAPTRPALDERGQLTRSRSLDNSSSNLVNEHRHPDAAAAVAAAVAGPLSQANHPTDRLSHSMHEAPTVWPRSVSRTRQPRDIPRSESINQAPTRPALDERGQLTRSRSSDNSSSNLVCDHHPGTAAAGGQSIRANRPTMDRLSRSMHEAPTDRPSSLSQTRQPYNISRPKLMNQIPLDRPSRSMNAAPTDRPRSLSRTRQPRNISRSESINQTSTRPAPDDRGQLTRSRSLDNSSSNLVYDHHHHPDNAAAAAAGQSSRANRPTDRLSRSMHEGPTDRFGMPPSLVRPGGRRPNASLERITAAHNARIAGVGGVTRTNSGISIDTIESFEI